MIMTDAVDKIILPKVLAPGETWEIKIESIPVWIGGEEHDGGWQRLTFVPVPGGGFVWTNNDQGGWSGGYTCKGPDNQPYGSLSEALYAALDPSNWGEDEVTNAEYLGLLYDPDGTIRDAFGDEVTA
jgi:hypothetical protein